MTLDGGGGQTFAVTDTSTDFSPCETNILTLSTPPLSVKVHAGTPPAWACVAAAGVSNRVKLDAVGSQGVVTFTADNEHQRTPERERAAASCGGSLARSLPPEERRAT